VGRENRRIVSVRETSREKGGWIGGWKFSRAPVAGFAPVILLPAADSSRLYGVLFKLMDAILNVFY
jgi:hypothetical protein